MELRPETVSDSGLDVIFSDLRAFWRLFGMMNTVGAVFLAWLSNNLNPTFGKNSEMAFIRPANISLIFRARAVK